MCVGAIAPFEYGEASAKATLVMTSPAPIGSFVPYLMFLAGNVGLRLVDDHATRDLKEKFRRG